MQVSSLKNLKNFASIEQVVHEVLFAMRFAGEVSRSVSRRDGKGEGALKPCCDVATQPQLHRDIYPRGPVSEPILRYLPTAICPGPSRIFSPLFRPTSCADDPCTRRPPSTFLCAEPPRRAVPAETLGPRDGIREALYKSPGYRLTRGPILFLSGVSLPFAFLLLSHLVSLFSTAHHSPPSYSNLLSLSFIAFPFSLPYHPPPSLSYT